MGETQVGATVSGVTSGATDSAPDRAAPTGAACLFCRIVAGQVPARMVFDTGSVVAFHDVAPKADVHVLVVPKTHRRDVVDLATAPADLADLVAAAERVGAELAPSGHFRLIFNTGAQAGQTVFHVHGHVLAGSGPAMSV